MLSRETEAFLRRAALAVAVVAVYTVVLFASIEDRIPEPSPVDAPPQTVPLDEFAAQLADALDLPPRQERRVVRVLTEEGGVAVVVPTTSTPAPPATTPAATTLPAVTTTTPAAPPAPPPTSTTTTTTPTTTTVQRLPLTPQQHADSILDHLP